MRFTFLAPVADMTGGARVIHIHASALAAAGHEVSVIIRPPRNITVRERVRQWRRGDGFRMPSKFQTHYRSDGYRLVTLDERRPILPSDIPASDAVIATWWETAEWMIDYPESVGKKVHFVQGYEAFSEVDKPRVDAVLAEKTAKITISEWLRFKLVEEFHNERVEVILNGVDLDQFFAPVRHKNDIFTVGTLYSNKPSKNTSGAFKIIEYLRKTVGSVNIVTFGLNHEESSLPLPLGSKHTASPAQHQIRDLYAKCDVWLCASQSEGFHLPPLEAMACRCPVVSTPVGGPLDIIRHGENGFLFPFDDHLEAAAILKDLATKSDNDWMRLSDSAHATAYDMNWRKACKKFEEALIKIVLS